MNSRPRKPYQPSQQHIRIEQGRFINDAESLEEQDEAPIHKKINNMNVAVSEPPLNPQQSDSIYRIDAAQYPDQQYIFFHQQKREFQPSLEEYYGGQIESPFVQSSQRPQEERENRNQRQQPEEEEEEERDLESLRQKKLDLIRKQILSEGFIEEASKQKALFSSNMKSTGTASVSAYSIATPSVMAQQTKSQESLVDKVTKRVQDTKILRNQISASSSNIQKKKSKVPFKAQLIEYQKAHSNMLSTPRRDVEYQPIEGDLTPRRKVKMVIANGRHFYTPIENPDIEENWNERYNYVHGTSAGIPASKFLTEQKNDKELKSCSFKPMINKKSAEMAEEKKRKKNTKYLLTNEELYLEAKERRERMEKKQLEQELEDTRKSQTSKLKKKTQELLLRKIERDLELAIRKADYQNYGFLTLNLLRLMLQELGILGESMQPKEGTGPLSEQFGEENGNKFRESAESEVVIGQKESQQEDILPLLQVQQSDLKFQQEEALLEQIALKINPENINELENGIVYDFFIRMLSNIRLPLHQTAKILTDYLQKTRAEREEEGRKEDEGDKEGEEEGEKEMEDEQRGDPQELDIEWEMEKIVNEFRRVYDCKYSYETLGHSRRGSQTSSDHRSQFSFKPKLNEKTRMLDIRQKENLSRLSNYVVKHYKNSIQEEESTQRSDSRQGYQDYESREKKTTEIGTNPQKRYQLLYYRQHLTEQKLSKARQEIVENELRECSFRPIIGGSQIETMSQHASDIFSKLSKQSLGKQSKKYKTKEEKELEQCTFKPSINNSYERYKKTNKEMMKQELPKGYQETIFRQRKAADDRKKLKDELEKIPAGENYERIRGLNIKPPNLSDPSTNKRELLLYVDVDIAAGKKGRIGIYRGDDLQKIAQNFCKTFHLNEALAEALREKLETHLEEYYARLQHGSRNVNLAV